MRQMTTESPEGPRETISIYTLCRVSASVHGFVHVVNADEAWYEMSHVMCRMLEQRAAAGNAGWSGNCNHVD